MTEQTVKAKVIDTVGDLDLYESDEGSLFVTLAGTKVPIGSAWGPAADSTGNWFVWRSGLEPHYRGAAVSRKIHPNTLKRVRLAVYTRDGFACLHCGWKPPIPDGYDGTYALGITTYDAFKNKYGCKLLELDHVHPYILGGRFIIENLQTLCNSCNAKKGARA